MGLVLSQPLLVMIAAVILGMVALYNGINGLKDVFPAWFDEHPMAARVFNAVGALLVGALVCIGGPHPEGGKSIFELIACFGTAVMTFLAAAGLHNKESKANASRMAGVAAITEMQMAPPKRPGR